MFIFERNTHLKHHGKIWPLDHGGYMVLIGSISHCNNRKWSQRPFWSHLRTGYSLSLIPATEEGGHLEDTSHLVSPNSWLIGTDPTRVTCNDQTRWRANCSKDRKTCASNRRTNHKKQLVWRWLMPAEAPACSPSPNVSHGSKVHKLHPQQKRLLCSPLVQCFFPCLLGIYPLVLTWKIKKQTLELLFAIQIHTFSCSTLRWLMI